MKRIKHIFSNKYSIIIRFLMLYTFCFVILWVLAHLVLIYNGKSVVYMDDAACAYEISWIKGQIIKQIFTGRLPYISYNLVADKLFTNFYWYDFLDCVFSILPKSIFETTFTVVVSLRVWIGGVWLFFFFKNRNIRMEYAVIGSLIYTFSGSIVFLSTFQPIFGHMFHLFPFLVLMLDYMICTGKWYYFALSIAISCVDIFYTYYMSFALVIVFLTILFERKCKGRELLINLARFCLAYVIGIGISMMISLPNIYEFTHTSRISTGIGLDLPFSIKIYWDYLQNVFAGLFSFNYFGGTWGYASLLLVPLVSLFFIRSRGRLWGIVFLLCLLIKPIPLIMKISSGGIPTDRWSFVIGLIASIAFVYSAEATESLDRKRIIIVSILSSLYGIVAVALNIYKSGKQQAIYVFFIIFFSITGYDLFILLKKHKWRITKWVVLFSVMAIYVTISGVIRFNGLYNYNRHVAAGELGSFLENYPGAAANIIDDNTFYRVDSLDAHTHSINMNLPFYYGYNGTSGYVTTLNRAFMDYYYKLEECGLFSYIAHATLGARSSDEVLASVKYYITYHDIEERVIPYGFEYYDSSNGFDIYCNRNYIPMLFSYDKNQVVSTEVFDSHNIAEKEEILLKQLVLDNVDTSEIDCDLKSSSLSFHFVNNETDALSIEEADSIHLTGNSPYRMQIHIDDTDVNGELYLRLGGVKNNTRSNVYITVHNGTGNQEAVVDAVGSVRGNAMTDYTFNLGYFKKLSETEQTIEIIFNYQMQDIEIENISVLARDMTSYDYDVENLQDIEILDLMVEQNKVVSDVFLNKDKWVVMSVPYNKNWHCFIDGIETPIYKGNIMYMAIEVAKGNHEIVFRYIPNEFYLGLMISAISLITLIILVIFNKKHIIII